jgi:hypothetical protein
MAGHG